MNYKSSDILQWHCWTEIFRFHPKVFQVMIFFFVTKCQTFPYKPNTFWEKFSCVENHIFRWKPILMENVWPALLVTFPNLRGRGRGAARRAEGWNTHFPHRTKTKWIMAEWKTSLLGTQWQSSQSWMQSFLLPAATAAGRGGALPEFLASNSLICCSGGKRRWGVRLSFHRRSWD